MNRLNQENDVDAASKMSRRVLRLSLEYHLGGVIEAAVLDRLITDTALGTHITDSDACRAIIDLIKSSQLGVLEGLMLSEAIGKTQSYLDPLTGALRRDFVEVVSSVCLEQWANTKEVEAVLGIYLDLDRFGSINKIYGQTTGDVALQETVKKIIRRIRDTDLLIRMGGDEFFVVAPIFEGGKGRSGLAKLNQKDIANAFRDKFRNIEVQAERDGRQELIKIQSSSGVYIMPKTELLEMVRRGPAVAFDILAERAGQDLLKGKDSNRRLHVREKPRVNDIKLNYMES
jgi:diguanylate cyclase (GGDEF)-like protein